MPSVRLAPATARWHRGAAVLALLLGAAVPASGVRAQDTEVRTEPRTAPHADDMATSAVETLLFETDHMAGVAAPAVLEYRFTWTGTAAFTDRVLLTLSAAPTPRIEPDYLSGDHHVSYPAVDGARGNPLLLYFLETDLREMQRQTGGQTDYFRRLIRSALARADLPVEAIEVSAGGRRVSAQRVVVAPFTADPNAPKRYPALKGKTYEFVLSPAVPGQIVSLTTRVAGTDGVSQEGRLEWSRLAPPVAANGNADSIAKQEAR